MSQTAEKLISNHLQATTVEAIMRDFAEEAVLITPEGTYRGFDEIGRFYKQFLGGLPEGFFKAFKLNRQEVVGEVVFILWEARPWVLLATDTFVVRNGKFIYQTFAAYTAP